MAVGVDDACPPHGSAQHVFKLHMPSPHAPVAIGENQLGGGHGERLFQVRDEFGRNRNDLGVSTLGGVTLPGARHRQEPVAQVNVGLPQCEQLPLSQPRVDGRGEQGAPLRTERGEHERNLLGLEKIRRSAWHLALLHLGCRILALVATRARRTVEGRDKVAAQVVDGAGGKLATLLLEERFDPSRRQVRESHGRQLRAGEVASDGVAVTLMSGPARRIRFQPPLQKIGERSASILGWALLHAEPLTLRLPLQLFSHAPGLGLRARLRDLVAPPARVILESHVPLARLLVDTCHGSPPP